MMSTTPSNTELATSAAIELEIVKRMQAGASNAQILLALNEHVPGLTLKEIAQIRTDAGIAPPQAAAVGPGAGVVHSFLADRRFCECGGIMTEHLAGTGGLQRTGCPAFKPREA